MNFYVLSEPGQTTAAGFPCQCVQSRYFHLQLSQGMLACKCQPKSEQAHPSGLWKNSSWDETQHCIWCGSLRSLHQHRQGDWFSWESRGGGIRDPYQDHIFTTDHHAPLSSLLISKYDRSGITLWTRSLEVTLAVNHNLGAV